MSRATRSQTAILIAVAALALIAAGCGSDDGDDSASGGGGGVYGSGTAEPAGGGSAGSGVVSVSDNSKLGKIIVDEGGNTLYYFKKDKQNGDSSTCSGACAQVWPPYEASGTPEGQDGAEASLLGTIKRSDGTTQVTYNGWPLYTYVGDKKPGDTNGNDFEQFGAEWYALTPTGEKPED